MLYIVSAIMNHQTHGQDNTDNVIKEIKFVFNDNIHIGSTIT